MRRYVTEAARQLFIANLKLNRPENRSGPVKIIYSRDKGIDRRTEHGIPIEATSRFWPIPRDEFSGRQQQAHKDKMAAIFKNRT